MQQEERISKEILHEKAGLWYFSSSLVSKIIVKVNSSAIKAVLNGCKVDFVFGKDTTQQLNIIHAGVRIYDDSVHYLSITVSQRFIEDHLALQKIMNQNPVPIHFHNELGICVIVGSLFFEVKDQFRVLNMLGSIEKLYTGDFNQKVNESLDSFCHSLKLRGVYETVYEIETLIIGGKISDWQIIENHFVGTSEAHKILADDRNEGKVLEQQAWVALESLFNTQLYKNPQVSSGSDKRELTDVFGISEFGVFLVETKVLSLFNNSMERSMERKVLTLQKSIKKAINQLVGATKKLSENEFIYDAEGREISFDWNLLPHCVVLVSELLPFGDWKEVELKMLTTMVENKIYLNVMDLLEFMRYVGIARGSKNMLDYLLIKRVESFVEHKTIHLQINEIQPPKKDHSP